MCFVVLQSILEQLQVKKVSIIYRSMQIFNVKYRTFNKQFSSLISPARLISYYARIYPTMLKAYISDDQNTEQIQVSLLDLK